MVVARYLGERARELLSRGGASYADATDNVRVVVSSPAIFLEGVGAEQDPQRAPRPSTACAGPPLGASCVHSSSFGSHEA